MNEQVKESGVKKAFPLIALAGLGLGLSLFAINPNRIRSLLRNEYKPIFDNLLDHSNEKDEVDLAVNNLPEGTEPIIAKWMNNSMEGYRRKIAQGKVRPHHVLAEIFKAALELGGERLKK